MKAFWSLGLFPSLSWLWILVTAESLGYGYPFFHPQDLWALNLKTTTTATHFWSAFYTAGIAIWDFPCWSRLWWFHFSSISRVAECDKLPTDYSDAVPRLLKRILRIQPCFSCSTFSISLREGLRFITAFKETPWNLEPAWSFSPLLATEWQWLTWSLLSLPSPFQLSCVPCLHGLPCSHPLHSGFPPSIKDLGGS